MSYEEAVAYLSSLEVRGWRLGLDRMQEFVRRAGLADSVGFSPPPTSSPSRPRSSFSASADLSPRRGEEGTHFIHVAGTNGKGSVTAFLQSMLVDHGFRTGAFFSPYVVDPRERVQYGREMISKDDFAAIVTNLKPIAESFTETDYGGISEFEFKTAVGFEYWRQKQCEWVALEVGLGGRLDATNVVHPSCSVIVSIGLDHTQILGDTLEKIAHEKAGIIKPGVPVVVGQMPDEARHVILKVADEHDAPVWMVGREVRYEVDGDTCVHTPRGKVKVRPSLVGAIQSHNVALAVAAMQLALPGVSDEALIKGAATAYIPGRFQELTIEGKRVILDGAHNSDAARVLRKTLTERAPGIHIAVIGMTVGHDPKAFLSEIAPAISKVHAVPIDFHRSQPAEVIAQAASELGIEAQIHESPKEALRAALAEGSSILVTGSFYLVGELLRILV